MISLARPKSVILGVPSAAIRTLAGDRSRCTTPMQVRRVDGPRQGLHQSGRRHSAGCGVPARVCASERPSTSSSTRNGAPACSPTPWIWTMFGCRSRATASASTRNRASDLGAGQGAGVQHLQGDLALQLGLPGTVDDPHAAPAQHAQDLVAGDLGIGRGPVRRLGAAPHGQSRRAPGPGRGRLSAGLHRPVQLDLELQLAGMLRGSGPGIPRAAAARPAPRGAGTRRRSGRWRIPASSRIAGKASR